MNTRRQLLKLLLAIIPGVLIAKKTCSGVKPTDPNVWEIDLQKKYISCDLHNGSTLDWAGLARKYYDWQ